MAAPFRGEVYSKEFDLPEFGLRLTDVTEVHETVADAIIDTVNMIEDLNIPTDEEVTAVYIREVKE
jgi:hypothetical protein